MFNLLSWMRRDSQMNSQKDNTVLKEKESYGF